MLDIKTTPKIQNIPQSMNIAEGTGLDEKAQTVAWLDASGIPPWIIEQSLGLNSGAVLSKRSDPFYRTLVKRCVSVITQAKVLKAGQNIEGLLESEIGSNIATMMEVRDNPFEKGQTRLKAAESLLDRTPKAPRARKEIDEIHTIISIPIGELQTIRKALIEEGTQEDLKVVELLEGIDYKTDGEGKNGDVSFEEKE